MPTGHKSNTGIAKHQETDFADVWFPFRRRLWLFVAITSSSLLSCLIRVCVRVFVAYTDAVRADTVTRHLEGTALPPVSNVEDLPQRQFFFCIRKLESWGYHAALFA